MQNIYFFKEKLLDFIKPFSSHLQHVSYALNSAYVICTLVVYISNNMDPDQTAP